MKRRISETDPENPSPIRSLPPHRSLHGGLSFSSQFVDPTSKASRDFRCKKRVKFTDFGAENPLSCVPNASSALLEGQRAAGSADPKTSEFAFFKTLKENAGHKFHSHKLHEEDDQSNCSAEKTGSVKSSCNDFRSSLVTENITPVKFSSFTSPLGGPSRNSEVTPREDIAISRNICSSWDNTENYANALNPGGPQHIHGEVFSRKRQKLRQWVVKTAYPQIEELCSKGRLFPENNENSAFKNFKSAKVDKESKSQSLASLESDFQLKMPSGRPARTFMELDYGSDLDDSPSSCWLKRSQAVALSMSYSPIGDAIASLKYEIGKPAYEFGGVTPALCADSNSAYSSPSKRCGSFACDHPEELGQLHDPTQALALSKSYSLIDDAIACSEFKIRETGYEFGRGTPLLCADSDSTYSVPSKSYGSFACNHLEELGQLLDPNENLIQREPRALLLGWDFDKGIDERNLSNTCRVTELSVSSPTSSSWGDDHRRTLDDRYGANKFSKSSFLPICSPKVLTLPWAESDSCNDHDLVRHVTGDKEDIYTDFNHLPSGFTLTPDCPTVAEDHEDDNDQKDRSLFHAPQNAHHIVSKVFSKSYRHPDIGFLLPSALDIELGWNFRSLTRSIREHHSTFNYAFQTPPIEGTSSGFLLKDKNESCLDEPSHKETLSYFSEDITNVQVCSPLHFHMPLDKGKSCPFLLNQSSWDGTSKTSKF